MNTKENLMCKYFLIKIFGLTSRFSQLNIIVLKFEREHLIIAALIIFVLVQQKRTRGTFSFVCQAADAFCKKCEQREFYFS
jgi:hypothetical protein